MREYILKLNEKGLIDGIIENETDISDIFLEKEINATKFKVKFPAVYLTNEYHHICYVEGQAGHIELTAEDGYKVCTLPFSLEKGILKLCFGVYTLNKEGRISKYIKWRALDCRII